MVGMGGASGRAGRVLQPEVLQPWGLRCMLAVHLQPVWVLAVLAVWRGKGVRIYSMQLAS
jgi:hypothetical protein